MRALTKAGWVLVLCGVLDAMNAAANLLMLNPDGSLILRRFALPGAVWDMGILALAAGACAIAAGFWISGRDNSWLLSLHGLALGAFGLLAVSPLVRGPLSFRPVSLLFVVMAVSMGAFALATARTPRRSGPARWFLRVSGAASISFGFSFVAAGFDWLKLGPYSFWIWMSSYFGFCAVFMLWLAPRFGGSPIRLPGAPPAIPARPASRRPQYLSAGSGGTA
jgi:uncharacterized membrane protein HdeD (DUF308 family)